MARVAPSSCPESVGVRARIFVGRFAGDEALLVGGRTRSPRPGRCLHRTALVGRCRWAVLFGGVDQERRRLASRFKIRALPPKRVPTVKPGKRSGRGWKLRAHA